MTDARKRILFVDDDLALLAGLENVLHRDRHRWNASYASTGERALEILGGCRFDLVVSDLRMPGMDGLALLERVRDRWPDTLRVMLSGSADPVAIEVARGAVDELVGKPCDTKTLREMLERMTSRVR